MANTTLSTTSWTDVSGGAANGFLTNESKFNQIVQESVGDPGDADVTGHTVVPGADGFYNWVGITANIWARALPNQLYGLTDMRITTQ